jgi:glycosyltransferase involved in cell wall biosynthesis
MGQRGDRDDDALRAAGLDTPGRLKVAFVVNGAEHSAMGDRARAFASRLSRWRATTAYRHGRGAAGASSFARWLRVTSPDVVYVFDMALAGVLAGAWRTLGRSTPLIIDTGDAIAALARSSGMRGPLGLLATSALERFSLRAADHIVVRGSYHRELLARQGIDATVIPDGVDLGAFSPRDGASMRRALDLGDGLVVGLVGSSVWSPSLGIAYGWDLIEMLAAVRDLPVRGLLVGDGSGVDHLRERARALGIENRIVFAGRRPLAELPEILSACDVCLSTQTNDIPGNVRTTGKLPLYLACGRYVLASRVGEAARVLPEEMLIPYEGTVDRSYPSRLADRVRALVAAPARLTLGARGIEIARQYFDYDVLAGRLEAVLSAVTSRSPAPVSGSVTT